MVKFCILVTLTRFLLGIFQSFYLLFLFTWVLLLICLVVLPAESHSVTGVPCIFKAVGYEEMLNTIKKNLFW